MERDIKDGLWSDKGYRIRCVKSLGEQIKVDYEEVKRLWKKWETGSLDKFDEEELGRVLAWLRQEIGLYRELGNRGIEGVVLGEIEEIEKDVKDKEKTMMKIIHDYELRGASPPSPVSKGAGTGEERKI